MRNIFISKTRLKLAKNEQKLSITLRLNFSYPKLFRFIYLSYHLKIIEDILQNVSKQVCLFFKGLDD